MSPGEVDLQTLLTTKASLHPDVFVFVTFPATSAVPASLATRMRFEEAEGTTVICTRAAAEEHKIELVFPCRMITLEVQSSLEAVGFLAAITARLTAARIGVNPVSGFYHDHLFVPLGREAEAMHTLEQLFAGH